MAQQQRHRPLPSLFNLSDIATSDLGSDAGAANPRVVSQKQREIYNKVQADPDEAASVMQFLHAKHPELVNSLLNTYTVSTPSSLKDSWLGTARILMVHSNRLPSICARYADGKG
jgi:hypothetical protein